ncbi:hypothetical protein Sjap_019526 [Stephania japonica]|uniref:Uncharacterized protein n=1 Tax=Stephania japonica TaxID=461633 RepID=A0AAP0F4F4_9MAGN
MKRKQAASRDAQVIRRTNKAQQCVNGETTHHTAHLPLSLVMRGVIIQTHTGRSEAEKSHKTNKGTHKQRYRKW